MEKVIITKAYYIKLGRGGCWATDSITTNKIRIGWINQSLEDIKNRNWEIIENELKKEVHDKGSARRDFLALKNIILADSNTIFITFHNLKLYWCKAIQSIDNIFADETSKYLLVDGNWSDKDISGNLLLLNRISGKISKLQRFAGTCCKVHEIVHLSKLINAETSNEYNQIALSYSDLINKVQNGIELLHPKDFEILVDLLFRQSGWQRISVLGESMELIDLELKDPITSDLYLVQIKSSSTKNEFIQYADKFDDNIHRKLYYIVHSPSDDLKSYNDSEIISDYPNIELIFQDRLAKMVVDLGMLDWLMEKVK